MVILEQAPVTKIPVSINMFSTRLFSALACIRGLIFEVMRTLSNQKWAKNRGGKNKSCIESLKKCNFFKEWVLIYFVVFL